MPPQESAELELKVRLVMVAIGLAVAAIATVPIRSLVWCPDEGWCPAEVGSLSFSIPPIVGLLAAVVLPLIAILFGVAPFLKFGDASEADQPHSVSKSQQSRAGQTIAIIVATVFVGVLSAPFWYKWLVILRPFRAELGRYAGPFERAPSIWSPRTERGDPILFVSGRVLPVHLPTPVGDKQAPTLPADLGIDDVYYVLPRDMRPGHPGEVDTLALIQYAALERNGYQNGAKAFQLTAKVQFVDVKKRLIVGEDEFYGSPPPDRITVRGPGEYRNHGSFPAESIIAFMRLHSTVPSVHCAVADSLGRELDELRSYDKKHPGVLERTQRAEKERVVAREEALCRSK